MQVSNCLWMVVSRTKYVDLAWYRDASLNSCINVHGNVTDGRLQLKMHESTYCQMLSRCQVTTSRPSLYFSGPTCVFADYASQLQNVANSRPYYAYVSTIHNLIYKCMVYTEYDNESLNSFILSTPPTPTV